MDRFRKFLDGSRRIIAGILICLMFANVISYAEAEENAPDGINLVGCSVSLSDAIDLVFYYDIAEDLVTSERICAKLFFQDGRTSTQWFDSDVVMEYGGYTVYGIKCMLSAKEFSDTVSIQLWDTESQKACSERKSYSLREYFTDMKDRISLLEEDAALIDAVMNYSMYAQLYFDYQTSDLRPFSDDITLSSVESVREKVSELAVFEVEGELPAGMELYGSSLVLNNSIEYRMYFSVDDEALAGKYGMIKCDSNGLYYFDDASVSIADLGKVKEYDFGTSKIRSNPMYYLEQVINGEYDDKLTTLIRATYDYYEAAVDYLDADHSGSLPVYEKQANYPLATYSLIAGGGVTLSNTNGAYSRNPNMEGYLEQEGNVYIGYKSYKSVSDADAVFINQRETLIFSGDSVVINGNIVVTDHSNVQFSGKDVEIRGKILLGPNCHLIVSRGTNIRCQDIRFFSDDKKVSSTANTTDYESLFDKQIGRSERNEYDGSPNVYYNRVLSKNDYYLNATSVVYQDGENWYDAFISNGVIRTREGELLSGATGITVNPNDELLYPVRNIKYNGKEYDSMFASIMDLAYFDEFCGMEGAENGSCKNALTAYKPDPSDPTKFCPVDSQSFKASDVINGALTFSYGAGKSADIQLYFASGGIRNPLNVPGYVICVTSVYLNINLDTSATCYCGLFLTSDHAEFKKNSGYSYGTPLMNLDTSMTRSYLKEFIDKVGLQITDTEPDKIGGSAENVKYVIYNNLFNGGIKCFYDTTGQSNPYVHRHHFTPSTCVSPETCTCGATRGSMASHHYVNGVCTVCGDTEGCIETPVIDI